MDALAAVINFLYWLPLAAWFGASVFVAVAAPVIFRVARQSDPILPTVPEWQSSGPSSRCS